MTDLKKQLQSHGYCFEFFQAVSLLEQTYKNRPALGHTGPVEDEIAQLLPNNTLGFPAADIGRIELHENSTGSDKWKLFQNFLGLYGPNSAAPIFIAESVNQCIDAEDPLKDFLDIFNHRVISLYYRAQKKNSVIKTVSTTHSNPISNILHAMMGHDFNMDETNWDVGPSKLLRHCGLFSSSNRNPNGLEKLVSDYFSLSDVHVIPFARRRIKIPQSSQGRLSTFQNQAALGESFILGEVIEDITGQFILRIKMPDMQTFKQFQPGEKQYNELIFLVNMYVQYRLGFTLEFIIPTEEIRSMAISGVNPSGKLGQSSWVGSPSEKETIVTINVSEKY